MRGGMNDPELCIDEHILLRAECIFINSIPFEGILTNKRVILRDKSAILLPRREIPLITIRNTEAAQDEIGDRIIILTLLSGAAETRQTDLYIPVLYPGTRIEERDAWMRILKEKTFSLHPEWEIHYRAHDVAPENSEYSIQPWDGTKDAGAHKNHGK